jgi:hypothetical protein
LSANLGDAVPDIHHIFSDVVNSLVDLAVDLGGIKDDLGSGKIVDLKTSTFAYPAAPANAAVEAIPSVSTSTSIYCDLGSALNNGLRKVSLISNHWTRGQRS